jgi:hypothetical protein
MRYILRPFLPPALAHTYNISLRARSTKPLSMQFSLSLSLSKPTSSTKFPKCNVPYTTVTESSTVPTVSHSAHHSYRLVTEAILILPPGYLGQQSSEHGIDDRRNGVRCQTGADILLLVASRPTSFWEVLVWRTSYKVSATPRIPKPQQFQLGNTVLHPYTRRRDTVKY